MAHINITIEFERPVSPEDVKALVQLLRGAVRVVSDAAAVKGQALEMTEKEKGDTFRIELAPKPSAAKNGGKR